MNASYLQKGYLVFQVGHVGNRYTVPHSSIRLYRYCQSCSRGNTPQVIVSLSYLYSGCLVVRGDGIPATALTGGSAGCVASTRREDR
ncbi:hypothetical protein GDO78_022418 [Eleutherodactylus coqui]|uniref:Uncharacterized protein n=1 Tax=Eleutherodactylus coqui TaxID=57060 RepID=A0A8J6EGG2_ELECQ|nr:hypothetical protein GDO78_022418 [Eleutherodactylus coqui]